MRLNNLVIYNLKNKKKYVNPVPSFFTSGFIFIKLIDSDGNCGFGEPSPYIFGVKKMIHSLTAIFLRYFKNKELNKINLMKIKEELKNEDSKKIIACFDQAIKEILAKKKGKTVAKSLSKNVKKKRIQLYASGGMIFEKKDYSFLIEEANKYKEESYFGWKFRPRFPNANLSHNQRIKNPPPFDEKKLINFAVKLRKNVGDVFNLMLDCGGRCESIKQAKYLADALHELNFYFLEEPLQRKLKLYQKLAEKKLKLKIAGGEHIYSLKKFYFWKKFKLDIFQPDTNLLTFGEIKNIEKFWKKEIIFHNWCNLINSAININYILSSKNNIILEKNILKNPYQDLFINKSFKITNGMVTALPNPGYGIKLKNLNKKNIIFNEIKI